MQTYHLSETYTHEFLARNDADALMLLPSLRGRSRGKMVGYVLMNLDTGGEVLTEEPCTKGETATQS